MRAGGKRVSKTQVKKEVERKYKEIFDLAIDEVTYQIYAVMLTTLDKSYGWREKRLRRFIKEIEVIVKLMVSNSTRHGLDAYKCEEYLKSKYGIDLREEVKIYE